ncbi:MAG: M23 family metallopeptidase [Eubacterium sp.]|nr:M23 family metallopeptidase [Eubacterium sp.]
MNYRQPFRGDYIITQRYGEAITSAFHTGIDYACSESTPILASADGIVRRAAWDPYGYGFHVIIEHAAGKSTLYAHLSRIDVSAGTVLTQGKQIGLSGNSGNSTGPHLHFEARRQWNDSRSHFDPLLLPLMNFADAADPLPAAGEAAPISAGMVRIVCDLPANVRNTYNPAIVNGQKHKGDIFEITPGIRMIHELPYHRIVPKDVNDLGGLIAEYDGYGNQILEQYDG